MTQQNIIDKFVEYRKKIKAWFEDEKKETTNLSSVTFLHFEQGFKDGYAQRLKEEQEEMSDAL